VVRWWFVGGVGMKVLTNILFKSPESAAPLMPLDKEGMLACCWWHCWCYWWLKVATTGG